MKKMVKLILMAIISLSSTFFIFGGKVEVEAMPCSFGQYWNDSVSNAHCASVASSSNQDSNVSSIGSSLAYFGTAIIYLSSGVALLIIIYSGFQYTMSEGDPYKIELAKLNLIRAGVGLLIAFSAGNILQLASSFSHL